MRIRGIGWRILATALLTALLASQRAQAESDYRDAQYVQIALGFPDLESGLRLIESQPNGKTQALPEGVGRTSLPSPTGAERFFYFDVDDSYINGGLNKVIISITYLDRGLTPLVLEYDSFDALRPNSTAADVVTKRVNLVYRGNTDAWKTERVTLDDARFSNAQPGRADFRIGSVDDLVIRNVSVLRVAHETPAPPIRVLLDGKEVLFDVLPYIDPSTGRTLVPVRALFHALGIGDESIGWDGTQRKAWARKGATVIVLTIDSPLAVVNNASVRLDQPAVIRGGRTLVPVRFVSEHFGLKVQWNPTLRVITLTSGAAAP